MWGMIQKDNDMSKSKTDSQEECLKSCHETAECVGFDYVPASKDCHLSKTTWKKVQPTSSSNTWVCEKKDGEYLYI